MSAQSRKISSQFPLRTKNVIAIPHNVGAITKNLVSISIRTKNVIAILIMSAQSRKISSQFPFEPRMSSQFTHNVGAITKNLVSISIRTKNVIAILIMSSQSRKISSQFPSESRMSAQSIIMSCPIHKFRPTSLPRSPPNQVRALLYHLIVEKSPNYKDH